MTKEEVKQKLDDFTWSVKDKASRAWNWVLNNPLYAIAFSGVGMKMVGGIYKAVRQSKLDAEDARRRLRRYDRRTGQYVPLTRELTGQEVLYVEQQWEAGRSLAEIYAELGVLAD